MKSFYFRFSVITAFAALACGGISDPTLGGDKEPLAKVSGALTGTNVPANARVALVWRATDHSFAVGADVAVVNGAFAMDLSAPPDSYFVEVDNDGFGYDDLSGGTGGWDPGGSSSSSTSSGGTSPYNPGSSGGSTSSSDASASAPPPSEEDQSSSGGGREGSFEIPQKLTPRDSVSGTVSKPLNAAVAGFVVYVDKNGNNKLDITGEHASTTDEIIGGNHELVLTFLKDGGALAYEKLRDKAGILPHAGYNIAWTDDRWMPLNVVDLTLDEDMQLPGGVCYRDTVGPDPNGPKPSSSQAPPMTGSTTDGGAYPIPGATDASANQFPDPSDPRLHCSFDGWSYWYEGECETTPENNGLCRGTSMKTCSGGTSGYITSGYVPPGWPCPVNSTTPGGDGGTYPDPTADGGTTSIDASVPPQDGDGGVGDSDAGF